MDEEDYAIPLVETVDGENAFRNRNQPGEHMRENVIQENIGGLYASVTLVGVRHGTLNPEKSTPATLIKFKFTFGGSETGKRRFKKATIKVKFQQRAAKGSGQQDNLRPAVCKINPSTRHTANYSDENLTKHSGGKVTFQPSGGSEIVNMAASAGIFQSSTSNFTHHATFEGLPYLDDVNSGKHNAVRWTITENPHLKDGLPFSVIGAVLLVPVTQEPFDAIVKLDTDVDWPRNIKRLCGNRTIDPVVFGSAKERTHMGDPEPNMDETRMQAFDMNQLINVVSGLAILSRLSRTPGLG